MLQKSTSNNRQVQRTRSWIFEALMILMDEKPYKEITVSDIAEKAGIVRQTFYRNYDDKDDVLFKYMRDLMSVDILNIEADKGSAKQNEIFMVFNYSYMITHRKILKKILTTTDIENRILRDVQESPMPLIKSYKAKLSREEYLICRYKICYQITGCLRAFLDWFINDMPMPADTFVSMLNAMNVPKTTIYRNVPNIVVRLNRG